MRFHRSLLNQTNRNLNIKMASTSSSSSSSITSTHSISDLPPIQPSSRLTNNLLADPLTPKPNSILSVPGSLPSYVRRSRPVAQGSHFSFLTPLTLSFPYDFPKPDSETGISMGESQKQEIEREEEDSAELTEEEKEKKEQDAMERRMEEIESVMRDYDIHLSTDNETESGNGLLNSYLSKGRSTSSFPSSRLLAISTSALKDCLPHLSIGDSLEFIHRHSGKEGPDSYSSGPIVDSLGEAKSQQESDRRELSEVLSGRKVLASFPKGKEEVNDMDAGYGRKARRIQEEMQKNGKGVGLKERVEMRERELKERLERDNGYAPWSLCYAGHQFGTWAGQLGDGRAITLLETVNPETSSRVEIQLKGAGRTPYSRFADGLATLASSTREFLGSEAMAGLRIPTSRALAMVSIPEVKVLREKVNTAGITTRLNSSWLRIGCFQIHSSRAEWESARILGEYVSREVLKLEGCERLGLPGNDGSPAPWARAMLEEVARRNAKTFALWQTQGFMHGVLNTDNIALDGSTIDYGPYAFMDLFDQNQICNHSDGEGRYAYRMQPSMGVFAIQQLLSSLSVVLGFEIENKVAPKPMELVNSDPDQLEKWSKLAEETLAEDIQKLFTSTLIHEWKKSWRSKLGLKEELENDQSEIIDPLLSVLEDLDFSSSIRRLSGFAGKVLEKKVGVDELVKAFSENWYDEKSLPEFVRSLKRDSVVSWLKVYAGRLEKEGGDSEIVKKEMDQNNPRFILRNWVGQEVIDRLEERNDTDFLARVLEMCLHPFENYGCQAEGKSEEIRAEEEVSQNQALRELGPLDSDDGCVLLLLPLPQRLCSLGTPLNGHLPSCSS